MLFDFEDAAQPAPQPPDVCIVGAGAAGIALALELERLGKRVLLLEGGGQLLEHRSQQIYKSEVTGLPYYGIHDGRLRVLGGTTTEWGGQVMELDDADFAIRTQVEHSGWPFPRQELAPFYRQAEAFEGLPEDLSSQVAQDVLASVRQQKQLALGGEVSLALARFCPVRNFAQLYMDRLRTSRQIQLYLHASVVEVTLSPCRDAIRSLCIRSHGGRTAEVHAGTFVLCMGGIETTRLLLQPPADGSLPWQTSGQLGRHYHDHIACNGIQLRDLAVHPAARYFGPIERDGAIYQPKLRLSPQVQQDDGMLNISGTICRMRPHNPARDRATMLLRRARQGRSSITTAQAAHIAQFLPAMFRNWISHRIGHALGVWRSTMLQLHAEQSPGGASTISLSDQRDALGLFRTRLRWSISQQELHTLRAFTRRMQQSFAQSGFGNVAPPTGFFTDDAVILHMCKDSNHHMGSTRMSAAPADGVVDPHLRLHGVRNGYVCSASVFPTGGTSNPTHTLLALAMRLAEHLTRIPDIA